MSAIPFKVEKSDKAWWFDRYYYHCVDCGTEFYHHKCDSRTSPYCCTCRNKREKERAKILTEKREQKKAQEIRNKALDEFAEALKEKAEEMFRQKYVDVRDIDEIAEQLKGVRNEN